MSGPSNITDSNRTYTIYVYLHYKGNTLKIVNEPTDTPRDEKMHKLEATLKAKEAKLTSQDTSMHQLEQTILSKDK